MIKQLLTAMLAAQIALGIAPAKVQAEDISAANARMTDSASQIAESVANEQVQNRVNTGPHVFAAVTASGRWGTCPWSLSSDGVLTISAGTGQNTFGTYNVPWYIQRKNIKSVKLTGEVKLPQSVTYLFSDCRNLTTFDASNLDTSAVTNMRWMFKGCSSLTTLDVSKWNTSAVTNMYGMFNSCSNLTTLNVSNWNTSKVTDMNGMFRGCSRLTTLDVSKWNTGQVTDMSWMFTGCSSLTTLDVSKWNTSAVTNMRWMFKGCSSLTTLDVSKWNTSAVTNMYGMFNGCSGLTTLDVSNWNTGSVTNMYYMFDGCSSLVVIKIGSGFVISTNSANVFPAPSKTISGRASTGTWGLGSETAEKQYTASELATLGQTPGALTGTWYAQSKALTFKSWNTKPDGSGTTYAPGDALPNQNLDLYAQWG